jgi:NAD(P)-dependent dehydrogenase (short-subunit alcohol dehydrogenase family)
VAGAVSGDAVSASAKTRWLEGARVLVTGAAGALGGALVAEADRRGATVVASGRRPTIDEASLPEAAIRIAADLRDPDDCRRLVREAAAQMGGLDIVVNNAAVLVRSPYRELEVEDMDEAWAVNLRAPAIIMQESFEHLRAGRSPAIVNVVSTAGVSGGIAPAGAYGMTKAGLIVLTKAVAREYGPHGIRVFTLSPPTLDSQMQRSLDESERARVAALNVLRRPATLEETARFALLAASGLGSLVAGTMVDLTATAY